MRFTSADVARYAEWSSDRNPLHVDPAFARGTFFGRAIVHGMLSVTRALDEAEVGLDARHFDIEFRGALAPDESYDLTTDRDSQAVVTTVRTGAETVLRIRSTAAADDDLSGSVGGRAAWAAGVPADAGLRDTPADRQVVDIASLSELVGRYRTPATGLNPGCPTSLRTQVFALCSYIVGMEVPGLRSLFTRAEIAVEPAAPPLDELLYRVAIRRVDEQFRMLDTHVEVASADGRVVAACHLRSYVRFSPIVSDLDAVAHAVEDLTALDGRVALVSGGSRGLGADIAAALALAGARVFVNYRQDVAGATALQARLATLGRHIELLPGDAGDPTWCAETLATIARTAGSLDILVLNACAPPTPLAVGSDTLPATQQYLTANLPLVQAPLGTALADLRARRGTVVYVSSSYVTDMPAKFGHYVALKQAGEALVTTASREAGSVRAVILRPPPLQTAWNDTPTGALGTIAADRVAVTLARTLAHEGTPQAAAEVVTEFPDFDRGTTSGTALPSDAPAVSLAVTASFTPDPLEKGIAFWGRELGVRPSLTFAPYSQVLQTLFDPSSNLSTNTQGLNVVLLRAQDWLRELPAEQREDEAFVRAHLETTTRDLVEAMRAHRGRARAATLLLLCPSSASVGSTSIGALLRTAEADVIAQLDGVPGLQLLRASDLHDRYAVDPNAIDDTLRDKIGHIPYTEAYFHVLASILMRQAWRRLVAPRKVVVVDCDNTLWRGVVGEVGAEGVEFDDGHMALHDTLTTLSASGVLVCLCSKNEEDDVWRVFDTRPELRLRREHVVAAMINWQRKSENIRHLASTLNLGLDSFVFLDDNQVECAEVRAGCPEVLTLEWPHDAEAARRLLDQTWELDVASATAEDRKRTQMYREEFGRQALRQGSSNFRDFLASLDLVVDVSPLSESDIARASQLTLRTNQFNFTTIRRDESELRALQDTGRHEIRTVRVRDRFGDYGLVGLLIAERQPEALVTDTFLMSCRVLGRGAEHHMAAELGRMALAHGLDTVHMHVEPTKRNAPAQKFLASLDGNSNARALDLSAATLATLRYEPQDAEPEAVADEAPQPSQQTESDTNVGERTRTRERQIARTATSLATQYELALAIDGRPLASSAATSSRDDVADVVRTAFARSLGRPVAEVVAIDQLEALGCDSFRIVEITVGLVEHFPWLPSTLLFEHRSVREIIDHIERMADARSRPPTRATVPVLAATSARHVRSRDIAVVGMDLRCAGANSPDELWDLLSRGAVALRPVPPRRRGFTRPLEDTRPHWAGLLDDLESFDAAFFGISPREADLMDPQLRLFLQVAWGALEDANAVARGVDPETGVFVGMMYDDYAHHANRLTRGSGSPYKSWESFSLANRLSQVLGLRGPSLVVDTACSSSGTALHLACRAIADGDCQTAIVGGVNVILDPDRFAQLGRLGILSPTGRCLSFGKDADGTVLGEGVGVVVLRPLDAAVERGDHIYGVIKGTGVSTGSGTVGFTAPNPQAQAAAIRRALDVSGVDPATVSYVETHGTATLLGDPIEVRGLTLGYGVEEGRGPSHLRIGSIKPSIGHLEAGAAVLSLIKVLLQLDRRTLLPSVSSAELNPQIPFGHSPFSVQRALETWDAGRPRRAAVSSFGVGGANVHVVVEEGPEPAAVESIGTPPAAAHLVTLSARSADALTAQAHVLGSHLTTRPDLALGDVAHTLNVTRRPFEHRAAFVVGDVDALRHALEGFASGEATSAAAHGVLAADAQPPRVAFLFTGQGAQFHGMGRALYETQPVFREAIDECASHLDALLDVPLASLLYDAEPDDEQGRLDQTRYTQPALFAVEYALARLWQSWGVQPSAVIGHSVGEFAAMCIAGGLSVADAARLIEARGRLMQALPAGGVMVSVTAAEARVREALEGFENRASIAGINSPEQTVVSGEREAVDAVVAALKADGIRTRPLTVSHAFHSPLMRPMVDAFREVVASVRFTTPSVPVVSCVTGARADDAMLEPEYWVRQILEPVRFVDGITRIADLGASTCLEIGPQPVLIGLGRRSLGERGGSMQWLPSLRKDADDWTTLLGTAAQLYTSGASLDWAGVERPAVYRQVSLPHYAFETRSHWVAAPDGAQVADVAPMRAPDVATYALEWRRRQETAASAPAVQAGTWLVFGDRGDVSSQLVAALEERGARCVTVPSTSVAAVDAVRTLLDTHAPVQGVVHLRSLDAGEAGDVDALRAWRAHALDSAVAAVQASAGHGSGAPVWCVTRGAVAIDGDEAAARSAGELAQAALWGFGRTAALELPEAWGGLVDLPGTPTADDMARLAYVLSSTSTDDQVAIRAGAEFVPRLVRRSPAPGRAVTLSADVSYLVTGGMGALGLQVARWLVDHGARHLVLMGRHARNEADIEGLRKLGVSVSVEVGDVSDPDDVDAVMARLRSGAHPLRGLVHAAGVDRQVPLQALGPDDVDAALAPKLAGGWLLHDRTRDLDLDFFVVFSSLASVLGAAGRASYAAANACLDAIAVERRRLGLPGLSIGWGPWAGEGMGADPETARQFAAIGNHALDAADALHILDGLMSGAPAHVAVADLEWDRFGPAYEARRPRPLIEEVKAAGGPRPSASARDAGTTATPDEVAAEVREEVAAVLGFKRVDDLPLDRGFFEMGLDSLSSVELVARLRQRFGVDCQGFVFDTPTVAALTDRIVTAVVAGSGNEGTGDEPAASATAQPPSAEKTVVVLYEPSMEEALFAFNVEAFEPPRRRDWITPRWHWMFEESARRIGEPSRVWVTMDDGRMTAHHGAIPVDVHISGERLRTAWMVETMVLASHRSRALGPQLLQASLRDVPFALSLGQSEAMRTIQLQTGWTQVAPLQTAQLLVRPERVLKGKLPPGAALGAGLGLRALASLKRLGHGTRPMTLHEVSSYGSEHDALWARMAESVGVAVVRDASYLNWKFVRQPGQSFLRYDVRDAGRLVGTTVWMIREPDDAYRYRRAFLVDLVAPLTDASDLEAMLRTGSARMEELGVDAVVCLHTSDRLTHALSRAGFTLREPGRFLLVHPGALTPEAAGLVLDGRQWLVTQGDSDIDRPW